MQDTKTVVGKLELVIGVVLHIIFIFFYLMVFNVSSCTSAAANAVMWYSASVMFMSFLLQPC